VIQTVSPGSGAALAPSLHAALATLQARRPMMSADTYVAHLLAIREAQSLRELQRVRRELTATRADDDAQTRFVRDQIAERALALAVALSD
jgi:hypothetical protein